MKPINLLAFLLLAACGSDSSENADSSDGTAAVEQSVQFNDLADKVEQADKRLDQIEQSQAEIADETQRQKQATDDLHNRVFDLEKKTVNLSE